MTDIMDTAVADDTQQRKQKPEAGAAEPAQAWAARRHAVHAAAASDRKQAEEERRSEPASNNPRGVWLGLLVVVLLILAGWFIVNRMRCDPFYANVSLASRDSCR